MFELDEGRHSRLKAARLTKYDRDEILSVAREYEQVRGEYNLIVHIAYEHLWLYLETLAICDDLHPRAYIGKICWWSNLDEGMTALYRAVEFEWEIPCLNLNGRSKSGETFPLTKWRGITARNRAAYNRVLRALKAALTSNTPSKKGQQTAEAR
jgi:hypothetical protein